jgi:hypothetical protein
MWLDGSYCQNDPRYWVSSLHSSLLDKPNHEFRLSCRLPQTPRTPSTGMDHYFDDIFTRHVNGPNTKNTKPKLRRTSTARSMAARSDFGDDHDDDARSIGNSIARSNSVAPETEERQRERREADAHTAHYVSEQLTRVKSHASVDFEGADEFEAQLDEGDK